VSPYAKPRFVDHTVASFASMLAFTERTFGVAPLSSVDGDAYDFSNAFDFDQAPLSGIELVQHRVPQATLDWIASHPADPNDPT
jgi:hypothetical protein